MYIDLAGAEREDAGVRDISSANKQNRRLKQKSISEIRIDDICIEIERKKIKNLHLRVYPPDGTVRISAPLYMRNDMIQSFAASKIDWIRRHRDRIRESRAVLPSEFVSGESHFFMGKSYKLELTEQNAKPHVEAVGEVLRLYVRPGADREKRMAVMDDFYRRHLKEVLPGIISRWEKVVQVKVNEFGVKKMKTKWGTCNRKARRIWINLELAKKPPECLEYIVVHELTHLLERYHNSVFYAYMDRFLPQWREYRKKLNS